MTVSLMGFSAGSMLTLAMCGSLSTETGETGQVDGNRRGAAGGEDAGKAGEARGARGDTDTASFGAAAAAAATAPPPPSPPSSPPPLPIACAVAIHGPDRIRDVFEAHQSYLCRLDILFSQSLFATMIRSGFPDVAPLGQGGIRRVWGDGDAGSLGSFLSTWLPHGLPPWVRGWDWMRTYTEEAFGRPWMDMEDALWSCRPALSRPLSVPVMRVLSTDDPVVPFGTINKALLKNCHSVVIQNTGGHCAAFTGDPSLAGKVAAFAQRWQG